MTSSEVTLRPLLWILLALSGCEPLSDDDREPPWPVDTGDTGEPAERCPSGMAPVAGVTVNVRTHSFNTLNVQLSFDPDATWEGQAAACASPDRLRARVLLLLVGEPYAWLTSDAPRLGSLSPITDRSLTLNLFAAEPPTTFGPDSWFQGTWTAQDTGIAIEHGVDVVGRSNEQAGSMLAFMLVPR